MDQIIHPKKTGEPLEPVPPHRWSQNVISSEGDKISTYSPTTSSSDDGDPGSYDESSSGIPSDIPSSDENVSVVNADNVENSPPLKKNKFSKNTVLKSSWKGASNQQNASHKGEQTPHTNEKFIKKGISSVQPSSESVAMRAEAAASPQPIRVRDVPLPTLSWTDCTDLSQLMCYKEDIAMNERKSNIFRKDPNLNTRMRAILFDWLMEVCDVYKLRRVTYYLAIDYIDRYLSKTEMIQKNHLQLLGITCLFIAAKVEEIYPPKLAELAYVTDGACTDTDMLAKEMEILSELRWDVNPMTVTGWLCLYLQLACTKANEIREMMRRLNSKDDDIIYPQFSPHLFMTGSMLVDLCSLDDGMMQFKYSVIAASVIYYLLNREKALFVSGYTWNNIRFCVEWMDPFALVAFRTLNVKPLVVPRDYPRNGSALRVVNPSIVLDEAHTLQNHVVDLSMLEEVYTEIKIMRHNFKTGKIVETTGWTVSTEGFDQKYATAYVCKRRMKRKIHRCSFVAQNISRNNNLVQKLSEASSESDNENQMLQSKTDCVVFRKAEISTNEEKSICSTMHNEDSIYINNNIKHSCVHVHCSIHKICSQISNTCNSNNKIENSSEIKVECNIDDENHIEEMNSNKIINSKSSSSDVNKTCGTKRRRDSNSSEINSSESVSDNIENIKSRKKKKYSGTSYPLCGVIEKSFNKWPIFFVNPIEKKSSQKFADYKS